MTDPGPTDPSAVPGVHRAAVALGSNVQTPGASRLDHLRAALDALDDPPRTVPIARSSIHETAPVGPVAQGPYLNAAAIVRTTLSPRALLDRLLEIERSRGRDRTREQRWGPRTLDLDLLLFDDILLDEPALTLPHPRMHERRFVLAPLAEIAPAWVIPGPRAGGRTVSECLALLQGPPPPRAGPHPPAPPEPRP